MKKLGAMTLSRNSFSDIWTITKRNLMRFRRTPEIVIFSSIQPIMFLLLFNYVFGGAINASGVKYINFLLPGIMAQNALFGTLQTAIGLVEDLDRGVVDRLRSLPITRAAVLAGRTFADNLRSIIQLIILLSFGYVLGFRPTEPFTHVIYAFLLILFFSYGFSWLTATLGLFVRNAEAVNTAGFLFIFPLTFASSVFVPVATMPGWLQAFAKNQPVTQLVNALRVILFGSNPALSYHSVWITLAWAVGFIIVCVPLAIWKFRKTV